MKKLLTLVLALVFVLVVSSFALAIGDSDTVYYITGDGPCYLGHIYGLDEYATYDFQYYQNGETYLTFYDDMSLISSGSELVVRNRSLGVVGSYLFDSGIFLKLGVESQTVDMLDGVKDSFFLIAPGYRFDFDEESYLAGYVEYSRSSALDESFISLKIYGKHFSETMKITEELYSSSENTSAKLQVNYLISDGLVVGGNLNGNWYESGDSSIGLSEGCSFSTDRLIANLTLGGSMENLISTYRISAIYYFTDSLGFGVTCSDSFGIGGGTPSFSYKGKYRMDNGQLVLKAHPSLYSRISWTVEYQKIL